MLTPELTVNISIYSQLLRCRRPVITDTLIIQTAAKSHTKTNHRFLTEMNSRYYRLSLIMTLTHTVSQQKVVSDSPGLVDFAIGLVNSVINLPDGQVNFFEEFKLQKNCEINLLIKTFFGLVEMIFGLVNVSFSLPEWQAVKMTFFAPGLCPLWREFTVNVKSARLLSSHPQHFIHSFSHSFIHSFIQ